MNMKKFIGIIAAFALLINVNAQIMNDQGKKATDTFLKSFKETITKENYKMFGFESFEDVSVLSAGHVYSSMIITLENLKKYDGTSDVKLILTNVKRSVCTVVNSRTQRTIAMVDLEQQKENFVVKGFANSDIAKAFDKVDKNLLNQNMSIVRIPALNIFFGSFTDATNKMQFVSLQNNSMLHTEIGEVREASLFLKDLVPQANAYNGLPW